MVSETIPPWINRWSLLQADPRPWKLTWDLRSSRRQTMVSRRALMAGSLFMSSLVSWEALLPRWLET